jgi:glycosyltransferase involved in cell wall biosynthesis
VNGRLSILEVGGSGNVGVLPMGPVTNVVYQLSTEFRRLDQDVVIADAKASVPRSLDVPVIEIDTPETDSPDAALRTERFVEGVMRLDPSRFDIVHVHEWRIADLLQRRGVATVYTAHTPVWLGLRGVALWRDRLRRIAAAHEQRVIERSRLTIALGDYFRIGGARIVVIPSGVRAESWTPSPKPKAPGDRFEILCISRLSPEKGVHVLVDALKRVRFPHRTRIIGSSTGKFQPDGREIPYATRVKESARGLPIEFLGFIRNDTSQFHDCLAEADVVVVPSLFEGQGTVVLEALSMSVPVVASAVGGIPTMVTPEVGMLVPPSDPDSLARALEELQRSPERRAEMARRARPHVLAEFSWDRCARRHLDAFRALAHGTPAAMTV